MEPNEVKAEIERWISEASEEKEILSYRLYTYDVWGNHREGFDINMVYKRPLLYPIPDEMASANDSRPMLTWLKRKGLISRLCRRARWTVEDGGDFGREGFTLYFTYNGKPAFELRAEKV